MGYWDRVKTVLLDNSVSEILSVARLEWRYFGDIEDNKVAETMGQEEAEQDTESYPNCELCDHPHIRHSFIIRNLQNDNELKIGCECVTKFIDVDVEGEVVSDLALKREKLRKDIKNLVTGKKTHKIINNILAAKKLSDSFDAEGFLNYMDNKGGFTVNQLKKLLAIYNQHKVKYDITDYKLVLRKIAHKQQLFNLQLWQFKSLKPIIPKQFHYLEDKLR